MSRSTTGRFNWLSPKKIRGYIKSIYQLRNTRLRVDKIEKLIRSSGATAFVGGGAGNVGKAPADALRPNVKFKTLLAEDFHINPKNFGNLYRFLKMTKSTVVVGLAKGSDRQKLTCANGNYEEHRELLEPYLPQLEALSKEQLLAFRYSDVPVFKSAKNELLAFVLPKEEWQTSAIERENAQVLNHAWKHDREALLLCCAAAMYWIDYWRSFPNLNRYEIAFVFSGAHTYAAVLLEILRFTKVRAFVLETFMTGKHYFMEERYTAIPNASRFQITAKRKMEQLAIGDLERIHMHNAFVMQANKNVKQPSEETLQFTKDGREICLILGQVINDYAFVCGSGSVLNTIPAYRGLIEGLLENPDRLVIFKAHPWERNKNNAEQTFTEGYINQFLQQLPASARERVFVTTDWNLKQLFRVSDRIFTLSSQGGIEGALAGFKPYLLGGGFYSSLGFTHDYEDVGALLTDLESGLLPSTLSLSEYKQMEDVLSALVLEHLIPVDGDADAAIYNKLKPYPEVPHKQQGSSELAIVRDFA
ncbi:capsular polysaccharide export protein, LipB/KpsS family [Pseudovibrio flavus]|uniref:capsular polysaccharide export protein, LipB/KpsS family n=1 Tax=Pseudovibrio flavus TaxID=2529854 RepID=UPI00211CDF6F|nr:hypothetical protein [Pseudovibrio flavus]